MNVSFDDTSPYLVFSQEWRVQPPNDQSAKSSWQGTYHAAQSKGARVTVTFNGAGIYLYGSKGPGNAKYNVEIDDKLFYLDGRTSTQTYQQLLYGDTMRQGAHTIVLTHEGVDGGDGGWLDIDYILVTTPLPNGIQSQSNPGSFASTAGIRGSPAPTSNGLAPSPSDNSDPNGDGQNQGSTAGASTYKIVAVVLGALLGVVLLAGLALFLYRRLSKNRDAEKGFRYGTSTAEPHVPPPPTMHSRSTGVFSGHGTVPMSPGATGGPFDTPPGSHFAHGPTRSATSSPGPSVLQIGRSVALLDTTGDPEAVAFPRAHSSLSHNTSFSASTYGMGPDGAYPVQPHPRSTSFDALREAAGASSNGSHNRQSVLSTGSTVPLGLSTASAGSSGPSAWLTQPPEAKSKGKEWKSQGGAGQRTTRTWNATGGAPSIKTFVQVMDE